MKSNRLTMPILKKITVLVLLLFSFTYNYAQSCSCSVANTITVSGGSTTNINTLLDGTQRTITAGEEICIVAEDGGTATITGLFNMQGGNLYLCSTDGTSFTLPSGGTSSQGLNFTESWGAQSGNLYLYTDVNVIPYSTTTSRNIYSITWHNYKNLNFTIDLDITTSNAGSKVAQLVNYASGVVTSTKRINTTSTDASIYNYGKMTVATSSNSGGTTSRFENTGVFKTTGDMTRSEGVTTNHGDVYVNGTLSLGGTGETLDLTGGVFWVNNLNITNGKFNADAGNCAVFYVTNSAGVTCGNTYTGDISVIDASFTPDATACPSERNTASKFKYTTFAGATACAKILPVEFTNVFVNENQVIYWTTAQEKNNEKFIIERSFDGENFQAIREVQGAGDSNYEIQYLFEDMDKTSKTVYYRIKQIDIDGKYSYSNVVVKSAEQKNIEIVLFPNPVHGNELMISLNNVAQKEVTYEIISSIGQVVYTEEILTDENVFQQTINTTDYLQGVYLVKVKTGKDVVIQKLIVE